MNGNRPSGPEYGGEGNEGWAGKRVAGGWAGLTAGTGGLVEAVVVVCLQFQFCVISVAFFLVVMVLLLVVTCVCG